MKKFSLLLLLLFPTLIQAQESLNLNQSPPSVKWRSIRTENFDIIYSSDIEEEGQRVANLAEHYAKYQYKTMHGEKRRTSILLVNNSAESNGFVSPMPYMSHWFNSPSSFGAQEWFASLAVHEGRHMVQFNTMRKGGKKIAWYIFGDQGTGLIDALLVPAWTMEGDAVLTETLLTDGGRGRIPSFDMWVRANELSRRREDRYSYYRAYIGSYNDNYPMSNHYTLGYHMVTYGRRNYGSLLWSNALEETAASPFFTFDAAVSRSNRNKADITDIYSAAYDDLRSQWEKQLDGLAFTSSTSVSQKGNKRWCGYIAPQEDGGKTIVLKTGKDYLSGIVALDSAGNETFVKQIPTALPIYSAFLNERQFTVQSGKAAWTEEIPDLRWGYRSYSSIIVYDIKNNTSRRIAAKGKILSAALSPDGKRIAGVEFNEKRICSIVIFDAESSREIRRIPSSKYIFDPAWSKDGSTLAYASLTNRGNALSKIELSSGKITDIIPETYKEQPKAPVFSENFIIYQSDYSGIDNIYACDMTSGKRFQITSRKFGSFFPSVSADGKTLCFSDYTAEGYSAEKMQLDPSAWTPLAKVQVRKIDYFAPLVDQEAGRSISGDEDLPKTAYESKSYSPLLHSINIHSWGPVVDTTNKNYGLSIVSGDILQTTDISASYIYNNNEHTSSGIAAVSYKGLYPVFSGKGIYGDRVKKNEDAVTKNQHGYTSWSEATGSAEVMLPFNFSRGIHTTTLSVSAEDRFTRISDKTVFEHETDTIDSGTLKSAGGKISFLHTVQGTSLDAAPRWGQIFEASYIDTPFAGRYNPRQVSVMTKFYFPSVFMHHSIGIEADYENNRTGEYQYESNILFPRGYRAVFEENLCKGSVNYSFPIANTAVSIWKIIYIKRLKGNLFCDYGLGETDGHRTLYRSAGGELIFEWYPLSNKFMMINTALRASRCIDTHEMKYEFALMVQ